MKKTYLVLVIFVLAAVSAAVLYVHVKTTTTPIPNRTIEGISKVSTTTKETVNATSTQDEVIEINEESKTTITEDVEIEYKEIIDTEPENVGDEDTMLTNNSEDIESDTVDESSVESTWVAKTMEECQQLLSTNPFYLDRDAVIVRREAKHRDDGDIETANLLREVSCYPQAVWLTWQDASSMRDRVETVIERASMENKIPVFVTYNSPSHGSLKWWVGNEGEEYLNWVEEVAKGIGEYEAWVIIEPDALGLSTEYSSEDRALRLNELSQTVSLFKEFAPNTRVYLDAGHSKWKIPEEFAELLQGAGIDKADGFALNISNYQSLENEIERGMELSALVGDKPFIIDTSRNGVGAPEDDEWCNAPDRALGETPQLVPSNPLIDAYFWIKPAGESDGTCNNGPTPGQFWLEYTLMLVRNAIEI